MAALNGQSNNYPEGQCTQYADERYHQLTGYYVPWNGNANEWSIMALAYGWTVSSKPIVPSIICLQGGVQGADPTYGHVGIVESVQGQTVVTTDLDWGPNYSQVSTVNFTTGPGVTFIYARNTSGQVLGVQTTTLSDFLSGNGSIPISLSPTAGVTDLLVSLDQLLLLQNPFNVNAQTDNFNFPGGGVSFTDPISWIEGFGGNLADDLVALVLRIVFLLVGVLIIYKVLSHFIDFSAVATFAEKGIGTVAGSALMAAGA
jgi:surface antigen